MKFQDHKEHHEEATEQDHKRITRRTILAGMTAGLLGSGHLPAFAQEKNRPGDRPSPAKATDGIPGPFPGRVVEVAHAGSVVEDAVQEPVAAAMVERGMSELVGAPNAVEAWRRFFAPGDVVGIKVNPVGAPHAISNFATVS